MVAVKGKVGSVAGGVSVERLRAGIADARLQGDGGGLAWSEAEWERLWARLTPLQQQVVFKHVVLGHPLAVVAEIVGIARGSADGAWRRALEAIRDAIPVPN